MKLTNLAAFVDGVAQAYGPETQARPMMKLAAKVLCRHAELCGDQVCMSCGCSEFDPCNSETLGTCGWAKPGLCTNCATGPEEVAR